MRPHRRSSLPRPVRRTPNRPTRSPRAEPPCNASGQIPMPGEKTPQTAPETEGKKPPVRHMSRSPLPLPFKSHRPAPTPPPPSPPLPPPPLQSPSEHLSSRLPSQPPRSTHAAKGRSAFSHDRATRTAGPDAMQILRLLAARRFRRRRRAVSTITATAPATPRRGGYEEDEGPFFDLDLSCCSAPASSAGSQAAESGSESDDCPPSSDLDAFVISLHRSRSASPPYEERLFFPRPTPPPAAPPSMLFCASEPSGATRRRGGRLQLRTLSFGSAKAALYGGRASFSRSASSSGSARSSASRLFAAYGSPDHPGPDPRSGDVFRRCLSKISSRLRRVGVAVAPAVAADLRLRKSRSAPFPAQASPPHRRDDSLVEKQDGIASAIAHCKESLHRASVSEAELDTSLLRSQSDPGP
ncbi:hypothetical protein BS78_03G200100 [Paspalum vaginatum]|nr:hypothetical protein BS78_03G200100 [Paspalum vaginatum]